QLYKKDERVHPWAGTAYGVLQAVNTFNHHLSTVRGDTPRAERNMSNALRGKTAEADRQTLELIDRVLVSA
ncbi:hypothetical protein ACW9HQ_48805, partial [Nocardia gipuzkoensis]